MTAIVAAESTTQLAPEVRGAVLVVGSHGGIIAAHLAASAGARAVVFNDAGVGRDAAGIAGLAYLERIGTAAATVAHTSARIGDGADGLERGVVSHVNALAAALGVVAGMRCRAAAERLRARRSRTRRPRPTARVAFCCNPDRPRSGGSIRSASSWRTMRAACSSSAPTPPCTGDVRSPRSASRRVRSYSMTPVWALPA